MKSWKSKRCKVTNFYGYQHKTKIKNYNYIHNKQVVVDTVYNKKVLVAGIVKYNWSNIEITINQSDKMIRDFKYGSFDAEKQ